MNVGTIELQVVEDIEKDEEIILEEAGFSEAVLEAEAYAETWKANDGLEAPNCPCGDIDSKEG